MQIIPVIDLRAGRAVRGRAGERARYAPVRSRLATSAPVDLSDPVRLLRVYRETLRSGVVYLADLDRIEARGENDAALARLLEDAPPIRFFLDGGFADPAAIAGAGRNGRMAPIIATETLRSIEQLSTRARPGTGSRPILGLDLGPRGVFSRSPQVAAIPEDDLLRRAAGSGFPAAVLILLDRIGTGTGLPRPRLARLRACAPGLRLYAGGGIAGLDDLHFLRDAGFDGALLAGALHDGRIRPVDLEAEGFLADRPEPGNENPGDGGVPGGNSGLGACPSDHIGRTGS